MTPDDFKIVKLSKASEVAKTISNKTAQLIIEHIGEEKKITATKIAKDLDLPASTVHYNMKALVKAGIVDDTQFTYSEKGKTIIHYTLTNNILVIVPESHDEFSVLSSIKALVPSFIGVGLVGLAYTFLRKKAINESAPLMAAKLAQPIAEIESYNTAASADMVVQESLTDEVVRSLPEPMVQHTTTSPLPEFVWGLLVASIVILLVFLVVRYFKKRK